MSVSVQTGDFDVSVELARLRDGNASIGAVVSFVGTVRDLSDGETVSMMELEHYPGMTEKSLQQIVEEAKERWPVLAARIIHRVGKLEPMAQIVLVAVAASHRADAFSACEFMMDCLKTRAPFWKKETTAVGSRWVDAKAADTSAAKRWQKEDVE
ncbi:molybdenum cofactor biosynthesis protein MoaE [Oxalobacter vibrioformis]|uniref:Molybdopterin synthase catalytic subunit n=1 Tax=Oxalobacter vibrioformis TaxID=933080 RepID=A0A9E9P291_9BURK|nr:molybdenum cofactor biosynthesis protein MoaE [Oxalobacter vibrioformis]WAW09657.1 molybdenum cofactor biosynthesis protein MoaE [Oxalobacter vibrioformis]